MANLIAYMFLQGARADKERVERGLNGSPLVVVSHGLIVDCDERAWKHGVRLGNTLRQAKISSPACQVVRVSENEAMALTGILDVLAKFTPCVEPAEDGNGIFVDLTDIACVEKALLALKGTFFQGYVGVSKSKVSARASAEWVFSQVESHGRLFPGKLQWGTVKCGKDYFLAMVHEGSEKSFLASLPLKALWPAPPEVLSTLSSLGLKKIGDLKKVTMYDLSRQVGDWAPMIKRWSGGEDRTSVRPMYPPPTIYKEVMFLEPVSVDISIFDSALQEASEDLSAKGLGFKSISLSLAGYFPELQLHKTLGRLACSLNSMRLAVMSMLQEAIGDIPHTAPSVTGFTLRFGGLASVFPKPVSLFSMEGPGGAKGPGGPKPIPVSLGLVLDGLENKFGEKAVTRGKKDLEERCFNPEIVRREKMLSLWDPMRAAVTYGASSEAAGS